MAHFAKIGLNNKVIEVHVVANDVLKDSNGIEHEINGIKFYVLYHCYLLKRH